MTFHILAVMNDEFSGVKSDLFRFSGDVSVIPFNLTTLKTKPFSSYGQQYYEKKPWMKCLILILFGNIFGAQRFRRIRRVKFKVYRKKSNPCWFSSRTPTSVSSNGQHNMRINNLLGLYLRYMYNFVLNANVNKLS